MYNCYVVIAGKKKIENYEQFNSKNVLSIADSVETNTHAHRICFSYQLKIELRLAIHSNEKPKKKLFTVGSPLLFYDWKWSVQYGENEKGALIARSIPLFLIFVYALVHISTSFSCRLKAMMTETGHGKLMAEH